MEFTCPKINKKRKDWYVWYRVRHPVTGKWKLFIEKKGVNRFKSIKEKSARINALRDAVNYALKNELINPFRDGSLRERKCITGCIDDILALKKGILRGRSMVHYNDVMHIFKTWLDNKGLSGMYPEQFTRMQAVEYSDYLQRDRNYSGKTHNIHIGALKTFYNAFIEREIVTVNPFSGIKKLQESDGSNVPYSEAEKEKLIPYLKEHNERLYFAVCFVYYCFIRRTELIQLKVKDIDLLSGVIRVPSMASKTKRFRSATIPTAMEPILRSMELGKYDPEYYVFGHRFKTCPRRIIKPESFTYSMTRINKEFGITGKSFYCWKHSGMVSLYNATHDAYLCMVQAGHSELKMTQRYLRSLGLIVDEQIRKADFRM